ncbi:MAG: DUF2490 domain-containing protein [Blastocatellia bacterium]|nr:DUF2490 domain-containing protein [Blastocatellia bacterium]
MRIKIWLPLFGLPLIFFLGGWLTSPLVAQTAPPPPEEDVQNWAEVHVSVGLNKRFNLLWQESLRVGDNVSRATDRRSSFGLEFRINKYLSVTPIYRSIANSPVAGQKVQENRLTIDISSRFPLPKKWTLSYRTQADFRYRQPRDFIHFRQRLQFERPIQIGPVKFQGFFGDEVFYDTRFDAWVRNRFSVGFKKDFTRRLGIEMAYTRQNDGRTSRGDLNILHAIFKVRLGRLPS